MSYNPYSATVQHMVVILHAKIDSCNCPKSMEVVIGAAEAACKSWRAMRGIDRQGEAIDTKESIRYQILYIPIGQIARWADLA